MIIRLTRSEVTEASLELTGSKSETNRLLLLQAIYPNLRIENVSESDDSQVLIASLAKRQGTIDVHHAGTAMRFLTAYLATQPGVDVTLTGSKRMQERPIGILVDALRALGAEIQYTKNKGYPPLQIHGKTLEKNSVTLQADVSSQFISALLLIAPSLSNGLSLNLLGKITSKPYIKMTLSLLDRLDIPYHFKGNTIAVDSCKMIKPITLTVESDWSSASYFYSLVALSSNLKVQLRSFQSKSIQGDSALAGMYEALGVSTYFNDNINQIVLEKNNIDLPDIFRADLSDTPDVAQTIAVTCFGLGIGCELKGLHTLKIKETDRLAALKNELEKLGGTALIDENSIQVLPNNSIRENIKVATYNDHRMAMAFAPLGLKVPIQIADAEVVSKSFPGFWDSLEKVGLKGVKA